MKRLKRLLFTFIIAVSLINLSPISTVVTNSNIIEVQAKSNSVYITKTGTKYHSRKCGSGSYSKTTLEKAKKAGLKPCKKCYGK